MCKMVDIYLMLFNCLFPFREGFAANIRQYCGQTAVTAGKYGLDLAPLRTFGIYLDALVG